MVERRRTARPARRKESGDAGPGHSALTRIDGPGHPVFVGDGVVDRIGDLAGELAPAFRYAIVTDTTVAALYSERAAAAFGAAGRTADVFTFPAGEAHKTRETWAMLTDELLTTGFGRDSAIIALGGGVVGDIAGFVAATFMRGIPVIQVPTTLAAMVDASIGGKTGVDTPAGKNLVGSFHPPAGVIVDPQVLATLPFRQLQSGFAEVLKHGAIADGEYFAETASALPELLSVDPGGDLLRRAIVRSIEIKTKIVLADVRESGLRKVLNFGHTLGHAIETASGYRLLHGEAVAIGMSAEASAAERAGIAEHGTAGAVRAALVAAGLPVACPSELSVDEVLLIAHADKKARARSLEFAVPKRIGEMAGAESGWTVRIPEDVIREVLQ